MDLFVQEVKADSFLALSMINVTLSPDILPMISMMMVGQLNKFVLSSTTIANSLQHSCTPNIEKEHLQEC
jgi:hypothetical protein